MLWFLYLTSEGIRSFKVVCEYICFVLDREMRGLNFLVEANLFLAIKSQPNLIIRAILQVASILRSKLKIEIEYNFY